MINLNVNKKMNDTCSKELHKFGLCLKKDNIITTCMKYSERICKESVDNIMEDGVDVNGLEQTD